jgi:hypothetical protein
MAKTLGDQKINKTGKMEVPTTSSAASGPSCTRPHFWDIAPEAIDRKGIKVHPAACRYCGKTRYYEAVPDDNPHHGNGNKKATPSVCLGRVKQKEVHMVQKLIGVRARQRGAEYRNRWPNILADAKALGAQATREKYGIPHTTWSGWMRKRADLAEALESRAEAVKTDGTGANVVIDHGWPEKITVNIAGGEKILERMDIGQFLLKTAAMYEAKAKNLREAARLFEVG